MKLALDCSGYKKAARHVVVGSMLGCVVLLGVGTVYAQEEQDGASAQVVEIKADKQVLELIKTWDETIWFFTSEEDPLQSLDGLQKDDVAAWGAEHIERFYDFLEAAGITYEERGMRLLGTGNPIFSGMENPPRLFITWASLASDLEGGVRVVFVEDAP